MMVVDQPIMLSAMDIWNGILNTAKAIAVIWAAYQIIKQIVANQKKPNDVQNARLDAIEQKMRLYDSYFARDKEDINDLQQSNLVMLQSVRAILGHDISGNNDAELRNASKEIDKYLLKHVAPGGNTTVQANNGQ